MASIRAHGEHALRVLKCQFGYRKTRYRDLIKNGAQLTTLFAFCLIVMVASVSAPPKPKEEILQLDKEDITPLG